MKRMLLIVPALMLGLGVAASADEVEFGTLKSKTPDNWKSGKPANEFRAYQFTVPKTGDDRQDAEVVVFFFKGGGGGSLEDNVKRQQAMFVPAEGKVVSSQEKFKVGKVDVAYVDLSGTYVTTIPPGNPNGKKEKHPDYRMLYVFFPNDNGLYTVRLVGPAKTVEANKKGFEEWIKNFK
jgi:hypothetical protein